MILYNGVLLLAAVNLAVNAALGLTILLHGPWRCWPFSVGRPDRWLDRQQPNTTEKGETTAHEQSLD
jgi:hypothetical protein